MARFQAAACVLGASFLGMISLDTVAANRYQAPFPPLSISLSSPVVRLSDFTGIALGFRKLTADMAWIQTLLYYGTEEEGTDDAKGEETGTHYLLFLAYCERVIQIDPNFKHVFYYGAGALGWNLNRLDEAEKLLREGIQYHPKEWRFQQFLAGLAFQKNHDVNKLAEFLEAFANEPDCPNMLRSILANIYKKQKRYADALRIWTLVYNTNDPTYRDRATSQIRLMLPLVPKTAKK